MQCPQCSSAVLARSRPRGAFENLLYLWGGEILRCLGCSSRRAVFTRFDVPLKPTEDESADHGIWVFLAIGAGVLFCIALGVWTLRRFNRWPPF